jgi:tetratricopeptide (TPR) repeat protein
MSSILKFLRNLGDTKDPSDALFAAGVEAWKKYEETRESLYLAQAVRNHQAALDIRVPDHPRRPESLLHTAMALWAQCQGAVTKESSSTVIAYYDEALLLLLHKPDKPGRRATIYTNLGMVYFTLFSLGEEDPEAFPATGSNIDKAIENYQSALRLRPAKSDPDLPISLINLSIVLIQKDSEDDLMNAIINLREAVELCTPKPTNRHLLLLSLNNLAQAYDSHYNYSEDISDVVGKVDALRRVLDLTGEGMGRLVPLEMLMNALWMLCEIEPGRSKDLGEAVLRGREALKLSDGSNNIIHVKALIFLANVLYARYVQTSPKNVTDLDEAIQYCRDAIDRDPQDGPDPILCGGLASTMYIRCQEFEEVEGATLEDAISYNQKALRTCPKDDPLYLKIQNNLGSIYLTQFNKSGAEGDLVKGIQAYEDVVSHCPDDNHGFTRYQETLKDAKRALQYNREGRTDKPSVLTWHQPIQPRLGVLVGIGPSEAASDETASTKSLSGSHRLGSRRSRSRRLGSRRSRSSAGSVRSLESHVSACHQSTRPSTAASMLRSILRSSSLPA